MKFGTRTAEQGKIWIPMAPMIAVVFQLLMFFLLNLRIISPPVSVDYNLPISAPTPISPEKSSPDIKVGLHSDRQGNLTSITLGSMELGSGDAAFERLNQEILRIIGRPGNPLMKEVEVEIDADFETQYKYVVRAISSCSGHFDPETKQIARYVEKIKFGPPHRPKD